MGDDNQLQRTFAAWAKNAEKFVREALRVKVITTQQKDGLRAVSRLVSAKVKIKTAATTASAEDWEYSRKIGISIMSGQGTGKDAFAAWVILWFLCCFPSPKIPCTAPTGHQLKDILWAEISKWIRNSRNEDGDSIVERLLKQNTEMVYLKENNGLNWFAVARTINRKAGEEEQGETLAGFHEDYMMYVVDEASGVPNAVFKPFEGSMTGMCNFVLMIFNPTRNNGKAIDSQGRDKKDWITLHWDAEKSEIVDPQHLKRVKEKYGEDSNFYRVRVKGLPPKSEDNALIPWEWIQKFVGNEDVEVPADAKEKIGIDVGGGGDKSIVLYRHGDKIMEILENQSSDTMTITGWASGTIYDYEPNEVTIDVIGIGKGVYDRLSELGFVVTGVNVANEAPHPKQFCRLRDELWWRVREWFEKGYGSIPNDDELIGELSSIRFEYDSSGRIKVEGKKELRKRQIASPNKADALCLTFFTQDFAPGVIPEDLKRKRERRYKSEGFQPESWMAA